MVISFFVLFDLVDGAMARESGGGTRFGAVLDATCDRISDGAVFCGLVWWTAFGLHDRPLVVATLICLVTSQVISYIKARAEASGLRGDGGFIERPERLIIVLVGAGLSDLPFFSVAVGAAGGDVVAGRGQHDHLCSAVAHRAALARRGRSLPPPGEATASDPGNERAVIATPAGLKMPGVAAFRWDGRDRLGLCGRLDGGAGDAGIRRAQRIRRRSALRGAQRGTGPAAEEPGPRHRCARPPTCRTR